MKKVLELPVFRRLLAVSMINELALSIGAVALALLVYRRTGSAVGATGYFLCAQFGPALISPLFVSRLDQRSVRRGLTSLYVLEGLIFLMLAWMVNHFALSAVLALALLDGTMAVTSRVLVRSTWTSATAPIGLMRDANAIVNTGYSVCFMIGPAIGGVLVATAGTRAALLVNVGVFALSTITIAIANDLPRAVPNPAPVAGRIRAALRYAWNEPLLRRLLSLQAAGMFFFTISIPVEVVLAQHTLHAGPSGYGVLLAAWGGGAIAGSGVYAWWRKVSSRLLISLGTCCLGAGFLVMALAPVLAVACAGAAVAGLGNGIQLIAVRTALQEATPHRWMALIVSLNESMFQAVPGAGIAVGGAIAAAAGPRIALATAAAGSLVVAAAMWMKLALSGAEGLIDPSREIETGEPGVGATAVARQR